MVRALAAMLLSVSMCGVALQGQEAKYRSEAHGFACSFPGTVTKKSVRTRDGLIVTMFQSFGPDKSWAAMLGTGFADPRESKNQRAFFNSMLHGMTDDTLMVADQILTTYRGRPAMKYRLVAEGASGRGMIVIDEDRFFALHGIALLGKDASMIEPFLESLEILER